MLLYKLYTSNEGEKKWNHLILQDYDNSLNQTSAVEQNQSVKEVKTKKGSGNEETETKDEHNSTKSSSNDLAKKSETMNKAGENIEMKDQGDGKSPQKDQEEDTALTNKDQNVSLNISKNKDNSKSSEVIDNKKDSEMPEMHKTKKIVTDKINKKLELTEKEDNDSLPEGKENTGNETSDKSMNLNNKNNSASTTSKQVETNSSNSEGTSPTEESANTVHDTSKTHDSTKSKGKIQIILNALELFSLKSCPR